MIETAVSLSALGHCYRPGEWVFRNYSTMVPKGHLFAVLGPNGRGKTTLLKLLLGAMKPSEGTVMVKGRFAFVPQLFEVGFDYSVLDMVLMGRAKRIGLFAQPSAHDEALAMAALERFDLAALAGRPFHECSGGQRQMVIFARALVAEADILILDEPTSSLDLKNQALVLDWIERLTREDGITILFTTHHPHHALAVADEVLLMMGVNKFLCGSANEVMTEDNLNTLYGTPLKRVSFDFDGRTVETLAPIFARPT
jgi:iron complex transport system ATP-binding protein